ncbi:MAG: MFS transporter [Promethearchaeota archaeon]|jgi:Na+/melibiose symporter-like transporter
MVTPTEIQKSEESTEVSTLKMATFSTGYFLNIFLMVVFNSFVWTFYEGELGLIGIIPLWPIYMAIANVVYTIWSMSTSPLLGYLTDKPFKWTKKWGFHTPWILIGGVPTIVFFLLLFTPPKVTGAESVIPILVYYVIFICLFDICYSLLQTHSFGAFGAQFRGDKIRRKAGFTTQIFTFIANFLAISLWSLIIEPQKPSSFTVAAFISVILLTISFVIFLPGSKETEEIKNRFIVGYDNAEKVSFLKTIKIAIKQKNFMLALFTYIFFMIAMGLLSMNSFYFVDDVLQAEQEIRTVASTITLVSSLLTLPIWLRVAKKIEHSTTFSLGLAIFGFFMLFNLFITDIYQYYIIAIFQGITMAMFLIMLSPLFADCYDEIAVKTKKHQQATLLGVRNFFVKITVTIQSLIIAFIHIITSYDPINPSGKAIFGLRLIQGLFPFLFCLIGALVFYKWYDLKGKKKQDMMKQLRDMGL